MYYVYRCIVGLIAGSVFGKVLSKKHVIKFVWPKQYCNVSIMMLLLQGFLVSPEHYSQPHYDGIHGQS